MNKIINESLYDLAYEVKKYNTYEDFKNSCEPHFDIIGQLNYKVKSYNWETGEFYRYVETIGDRCKNAFYDEYSNFEQFYNEVKEIELVPKNKRLAQTFNEDYRRWLNIPANFNNSTDIKDYMKYAELDQRYMNKCKLVIVNNNFDISEPVYL